MAGLTRLVSSAAVPTPCTETRHSFLYARIKIRRLGIDKLRDRAVARE
jgi:hypothetical protein